MRTPKDEAFRRQSLQTWYERHAGIVAGSALGAERSLPIAGAGSTHPRQAARGSRGARLNCARAVSSAVTSGHQRMAVRPPMTTPPRWRAPDPARPPRPTAGWPCSAASFLRSNPGHEVGDVARRPTLPVKVTPDCLDLEVITEQLGYLPLGERKIHEGDQSLPPTDGILEPP